MKILVPLNSRIISFDKAFRNSAPKIFMEVYRIQT